MDLLNSLELVPAEALDRRIGDLVSKIDSLRNSPEFQGSASITNSVQHLNVRPTRPAPPPESAAPVVMPAVESFRISDSLDNQALLREVQRLADENLELSG